MTIDPLARHRQAVHVLVLSRSLFEQLQTFFFLNTKGKASWKIPGDTILDPSGGGGGKGRLEGGAADRVIPDHGANKGTGLRSAGAHSFRAALAEQTCHGGFVCQAELPLVLVEKTRSALKAQPCPEKTSEVLFFL